MPTDRAPCSSREGHLCNIFGDLPVWNELFWRVGMQLKELSPGKLSLVKLRDVSHPFLKELQKNAVMLLQHLLTHHRCFCVVEINADMMEDHHELIREALRKSLSLRKLKLSLRHSAIRQSQSFAEALPHLTQLRDLELGHVPFDRASVEAFSDFLTTTRSLTTLIITDQELESEHAVIVIHGLKRNTTITTLSVNASLLSLDSSQCGMMFSGYIRWNKTLRTLTVTSSFLTGFADLRPTMGGAVP
ncbi:hypothetical protein MRX96_058664 [Rhipicephalus microplus]